MTTMLPLRTLAVSAVLAALISCGKDKNPGTAEAKVDTLAGGIVRTISSAPTQWTDSLKGWRLVLDHIIQPDEGAPGELFDPADIAMNQAGEIFVLDQKPSVAKVFDASGAYLRSIGHEGDGPGEFRIGFVAVRGDTLVVQDPRNARVTTFRTSDGGLLGNWRSTCCYWYPVSIDGVGRVVMYAMGQVDSGATPAQPFVRGHLDGSAIDTAWATERPAQETKRWVVTQGKQMQFMMQVPFQPRDIHGIDPTGQFISGWNGAYLLHTSNTGRDTTSVFGRSWTPSPVTSAERSAIVEQKIRDNQSGTPKDVLRAAFKPEYIPDFRPAFSAIEVDAIGNRWIRLESPDTLNVHYDVFDRSGRWLGPVTVPAAQWSISYQPPAWGADRVAVLSEDEEGRPLVRVYRIEKGDNHR